MHSMDLYRDGNLLVIAGGRNDSIPQDKILNDVWILKLHNLEWQRVLLGGTEFLKQRFNFASCILGSKLILAGGIGHDYKLLKDYQEVELDQKRVKKTFKQKNKLQFLRNQGAMQLNSNSSKASHTVNFVNLAGKASDLIRPTPTIKIALPQDR